MNRFQSIATALAATFFAFGNGSREASADITISNFYLTETSVSFDISGTFPDMGEQLNYEAITFENPDLTANPGFALVDFVPASSSSFTGSQPLSYLRTGHIVRGDFCYVVFENPFETGDSISGTITATWAATAFDPSQVTTLDFYWGAESLYDGIYLASVTSVPEPSSLCFFALLSSVALLVRRR